MNQNQFPVLSIPMNTHKPYFDFLIQNRGNTAKKSKYYDSSNTVHDIEQQIFMVEYNR